jgi:hypothetical protein
LLLLPGIWKRAARCCAGGTIVDATLIAASPSTKDEAGKRDPEMTQSKKGNQRYFGIVNRHAILIPAEG